jgi:hypothetical protein
MDKDDIKEVMLQELEFVRRCGSHYYEYKECKKTKDETFCKDKYYKDFQKCFDNLKYKGF